MVGFGAIAYGYGFKKGFLKQFPIPTHYAAVKDNNKFDFDTVVDVNQQVLNYAQESLNVAYGVTHVRAVPDPESVEIVVLTCPPSVNKTDILRAFPNLKGAVVEKPLGMDLTDSLELESFVEKNNIQAQVAYLRRSDHFLIGLQNDGLEGLIGSPIKADITYGNGLRNNGSHLIDLVRMLLGDVDEIMFARTTNVASTILKDDQNITSFFRLNSGVDVSIQPVDFNYYRENSLDIWGTEGRLVLSQEGSYFQYWKVTKSRFGEDYKGEIDWARPDEIGQTNLGYSLSKMYSNLLDSIEGNNSLLSPLSSAMKTESVILEIINMAGQASRTAP